MSPRDPKASSSSKPFERADVPRRRAFALWVSLGYAAFAAVWILASDTLLEALVSDPRQLSILQTSKGVAFVAITSWLLYLAALRGPNIVGADMPPLTAPDDRRMSWAIAVSASIIIGVVLANMIFLTWSDRQELLRGAERSTRNLAQMIDEHTLTQFSSIDRALRAVARDAEAWSTNPASAGRRLEDSAREELAGLPFVRAIFVVDALGRRVHDTGAMPRGHRDAFDRKEFLVHRDHADHGMFIGTPTRNGADDVWYIPVSRRLTLPGGGFGGIVVAALEPRRIERFYDSLSIGRSGVISLLLSDGTMLARSPSAESALGRNFRDSPALAALKTAGGGGTHHIVSSVDGVSRIVTARSVEGLPLIVATGLSGAEVLASWQRRAWAYAIFSCAFMLCIALLALRARSELRRRSALNVALAQSEERFSKAFHSSPAAQMLIDRKTGRLVDLNERAAAIVGWRDGKAHATGPGAPDDGLEGMFEPATIQTLRSEGTVRDLRTQLLRGDGSRRDVELSTVTTGVGPGPQAVLLMLISDVTEREAAEAALRSSETFNRTVLEALNEAVLVVAPDGTVIAANPSAERFFAGVVDGLVGAREPWRRFRFFEESGNELAASRLAVNVTLVDGRERSGIVRRLLSPDGAERWIQSSTVPLYRPSAEAPYAVVVSITDVTERKLAEHEVRRLNAELEERVAARTVELQRTVGELESFSYSVSHDLRAPIRHIDAYASLMADRVGGDDPTMTELLGKTRAAVSRMGHLVEDLLQFSRVGRAELREVDVPLNDVLREARQECMVDAGERNIDWRVDELPVVRGDPGLLLQVFLNVLGNAVKFTRHRAAARIEVSCAHDSPGTACIRVADNGAGFDARYSDKLFGVFQRLHTPREFEGTGIGLAIVKRIVERHGGRVWAESAPDEGARVFIVLPTSGGGGEVVR